MGSAHAHVCGRRGTRDSDGLQCDRRRAAAHAHGALLRDTRHGPQSRWQLAGHGQRRCYSSRLLTPRPHAMTPKPCASASLLPTLNNTLGLSRRGTVITLGCQIGFVCSRRAPQPQYRLLRDLLSFSRRTTPSINFAYRQHIIYGFARKGFAQALASARGSWYSTGNACVARIAGPWICKERECVSNVYFSGHRVTVQPHLSVGLISVRQKGGHPDPPPVIPPSRIPRWYCPPGIAHTYLHAALPGRDWEPQCTTL